MKTKNKLILSLILILLLLLLMASCTTTKHITTTTQPEVKIEYITKIDTTILYDSIFITNFTKHDTVFIQKFKYKYKEKIKIDTLYRVDTVPIVVVQEVEKRVEVIPNYYKKINKYFWGLLCLICAYVIIRLRLKIKLF